MYELLAANGERRRNGITDVKVDGAKHVKWEVFSHVQNHAPP
jgi:hypothetical protein